MAAATLASFIRNDAEMFRLSVDRYHQMIDGGLLNEDNTVELLEGVLVKKISKNPPHRVSTVRFRRVLADAFPAPGFVIYSQEPITLADSEPEPDLVLAQGPEGRYDHRHPYPADIFLVVEIADSSLERDTEWKRRIYAKSGIALYWILDIRNAQLLTYADPVDGDYRTEHVYVGGQSVALLDGQIAVNDVLPS